MTVLSTLFFELLFQFRHYKSQFIQRSVAIPGFQKPISGDDDIIVTFYQQ